MKNLLAMIIALVMMMSLAGCVTIDVNNESSDITNNEETLINPVNPDETDPVTPTVNEVDAVEVIEFIMTSRECWNYNDNAQYFSDKVILNP